MCLHHFQVQSGYLSASTWLPGNHIVFIFPRIFQMSHQLKYFPLVRPWLDLPQRLQWERAATTSLWQVSSFDAINTSSGNWSQLDLFALQSKSYPSLNLCAAHQVRLAPTPRLFVAPTLVITVSSNLSTQTVNIISSQIFTIWLVYAEFGASSTDSISLTFTYGSTTSAKTWNVLLRQISCTASYK